MFLSNNSFREIDPFESLDSQRLIGLIKSLDILPIPVCATILSLGTADPVRMNCPVLFLLSTSKRTASHKTGAICHSSISLGVFPFNKSDGFVSAAARYDDVLSESYI